MAKFCPKCGCKNLDEASFCSQCGGELPSKEEVLKRSQNNENSNGTIGINKNSTKEEFDVEVINPTNTKSRESPKSGVIIDQDGSSSNQPKTNENSTTSFDDNKDTIICCLVFAVLFLVAAMCHF